MERKDPDTYLPLQFCDRYEGISTIIGNCIAVLGFTLRFYDSWNSELDSCTYRSRPATPTQKQQAKSISQCALMNLGE